MNIEPIKNPLEENAVSKKLEDKSKVDEMGHFMRIQAGSGGNLLRVNPDKIIAGAEDGEHMIIDANESNRKYLQFWYDNSTPRGWIGKGENSNSDLGIHSAGAIDFSVNTGSNTYNRVAYINTNELIPDSDGGLNLGTVGTRWGTVFADVVNSATYYAGPGAGAEGYTGSFKDKDDNTITVVGGIITGGP